MNNKVKRLVFIAVYVAITIALDYVKEMIPFLNLPQGGSINIALIPIAFASFHLGYKEGFIIGLLWWAISSLMGFNEWFLNPIQYLLDYIIPSFIVGLSSIVYKKNYVTVILGIIITMIIRTLSIVLSGTYFWPDGVAAGSKAAWIASLTYNLPYSIATLIVLLLVVPFLLRVFKERLKRFDV